MRPMFYSSLPGQVKLVLGSPWLSTAVPLVLVAVCYWNGLEGELVHDDIFAIKDNMDLRPSAPISGLFWNDFWGKSMSSNVSHKSYRPLTALTFRLNYALHGLRPWGYHAVNVVLHMLVTALFGYFCRVVVFRGCSDLAFLAMMLFASHPVHTESVTGVVGRADVLACLFFLFALLAYRGSVMEWEGQGGAGGWTKLLLSVVCGCAAMLCKEHGVTVFGVCFAYDLLIMSRKALESSFRARNPYTPSILQLVTRLVVVGTLVAPLLIFRIWILPGPLKTPQFSAQDNPASFVEQRQTRVLTYSYLYYFNAKLLVAPITLCYDWQMGSIPLVEGLMDARNVGTVVFFIYLVGLSAFCLLGRTSDHRTAPLLGLLLLVLPFLPAANLLLRVGFVVAERILYIPSMGYCILLVSGVKVLSRLGSRRLRPHGPRPPSPSPLLFCLTLVLVALFGLRTVARNPVWYTRESLFKSGLETVPKNAKIHYNYGNFLRDSQRTQEAIQHYKTAISLAPDHAVSHNNLGTLLELEEAEYHFRQAVQHNPQHHRAFYNLGRNLEMRGRLQEAEAAYRESININPTYSDALMGIAMVMAESGQVEAGREYMQRAAEAAPDNADVHNNLAAYLLKLDKTDEAIAAYEKTLKLSPRHTTALTSLARIYRQQGHNDRAEETFKRSLSIDRDPSVLHYLGALYFNTGRYAEAATTFQEAMKIDPTRVDSSCSYGQALVQLSKDKEAIKVLTQAIQVHPNAACPHLTLANIYSQQKLFEKVLEHSSVAVRLSNTAEAYHIHGGALKDLGRLQAAEENFSLSVFGQNNYSGARDQYEAAQRLDPSNKLVQENLKKLDRAQRSAK